MIANLRPAGQQLACAAVVHGFFTGVSEIAHSAVSVDGSVHHANIGGGTEVALRRRRIRAVGVGQHVEGHVGILRRASLRNIVDHFQECAGVQRRIIRILQIERLAALAGTEAVAVVLRNGEISAIAVFRKRRFHVGKKLRAHFRITQAELPVFVAHALLIAAVPIGMRRVIARGRHELIQGVSQRVHILFGVGNAHSAKRRP